MLVLFVTFAIGGFAKEEVSVPDTTAVTFTQFYNDVKEGITSLSIALKVPAEHVYDVLVKQQLVNSIVYSLFFLGTIILTFVFINLYKIGNEEEWENTSVLVWFIIISVFLLIFIIAFMANLSNIIQGFINPEYGAIKDIMSFIK